MDERFKKTIQWTIYAIILLILLVGFFIPFFIYIFSKEPVNNVVATLNYAGAGLSFCSMVIAVYTIYTSDRSQHKLEESLNNVLEIQRNIQNGQNRIEQRLGDADKESKPNNNWAPDRTK